MLFTLTMFPVGTGPVTWGSLFVESHVWESARAGSYCPSEMCCFFVRALLTHGMA